VFRLTNPARFFREYSDNPRLKLKLAWLTVGGLVLPLALFVSFGLPEKYAAYAVLVGYLPFEYLVYCILRSRQPVVTTVHETARILQQILARQSLSLNAQLISHGLAESFQLMMINRNTGLNSKRTDTTMEIWSQFQSMGLKEYAASKSWPAEPVLFLSQQLPLNVFGQTPVFPSHPAQEIAGR
jgi:hypothetical protein